MLCRKCHKEIPADSVYCNYCGTNQTLSQRVKGRGNGQGSVYKRGKVWQCEVTLGYRIDADGKKKRSTRRKSGFATKKEALDYIATLRGSITKKEPNIADLYNFIKLRDLDSLSADKQSHYKTAWQRIDSLHMRKISTLSLAELQDIVDQLELGFYPCRDIKNLLSKIYEYAVLEDYCDKNLAQHIKLPSKIETERVVFSAEEIKMLWNCWDDGNEFAGAILTMIYAGLRTGELLNIKSESVDLSRSIMYGGIKTAKGKSRPLLIVERIKPIVVHFLEKQSNQLFPYSEYSFYENWSVLKSNLNFRSELVPYCARHTCATALQEAGTSAAIAMDILGHESYQTTIRYTHTRTEQLLNALNNAL